MTPNPTLHVLAQLDEQVRDVLRCAVAAAEVNDIQVRVQDGGLGFRV